MWLELPKQEQLPDGRIMVSDSFEEIIKLKERYGERFVIEPFSSDTRWTDDRFIDKVDPKYIGYEVYPFYKFVMRVEGENTYLDDINMVFIIPEEYRSTMKPGRYVKLEYEHQCDALKNYIKNLDTGDEYVAQMVGGDGDKEYYFAEPLINYEDEVAPDIMSFCNKDMLLPLCTKRIGYILPE